MPENIPSPEAENIPLTAGSSTGNPPIGKNLKIAKGGKGAKGLYGKLSVRLLVDHEHALRLASVLLERAGDPVHTVQQMVDDAMGRYVNLLQTKKNIDFQGIIPKKPDTAK